jgi:hypothetical protein
MRAETDSPADEEPEQEPATEEAPAGQDAAMESALAEQETAAAGNAQKPADRDARPTEEIDTSALVSFSFNVRMTADDAAKLSAEQLKALLEFAEKLRG